MLGKAFGGTPHAFAGSAWRVERSSGRQYPIGVPDINNTDYWRHVEQFYSNADP